MSGFDRNLHFGSGSCQMKLEAVSSLGYETLSGTFSFFCFPHLVSMVLRLQCFSHWIGNFTPIPTTTLPPKAHPAVLTPPSPPFPCPYMQALQLVKLPKPWAIVISEEAAEWYFDGRVEGGGESRIEKKERKGSNGNGIGHAGARS